MSAEGFLQFVVQVTDCGEICGRRVQAKIAATDPYVWWTLDYSWLPGQGWVAGDWSFWWYGQVWTPTDLLAGYNLPLEPFAGWYAGFMIDLNGDGRFDYETELKYCQFPWR